MPILAAGYNEAALFPRCADLSQVNSMLREQLARAGTANQGLTASLRKALEDAEMKDGRLRKEQEVSRFCRSEEFDLV